MKTNSTADSQWVSRTKGRSYIVNAGSHQFDAVLPKLRAPNHGKSGFSSAASDFEVAQFLSSNLCAQFPKFECFSAVKKSKSPNWVEKQLDCRLPCEWVIGIARTGSFNPLD